MADAERAASENIGVANDERQTAAGVAGGNGAAQQIVGRERRERVSQLAWCGEGCFDSRRRVNSTVRRLAGGARLGGDYGYANVDSYFRGRTWHYHWPRPRGATPEPQAPPCAEQVVRSRACVSHIYRAGDIPLTLGVDAL